MTTYYHLRILDGLTTNRSLLSCGPDGTVNLWDHDDGSGRQRWVLRALGNSGPQQLPTYAIDVYGGISNANNDSLGVASDQRTVKLLGPGSGSGNQNLLWYMMPVSTGSPDQPVSLYNLIPVTMPDSFLSCSEDGAVVDIWNEDDGSGRQRWQLEGPHFDVGGGPSG